MAFSNNNDYNGYNCMVIAQQACKEHWGGSFDEVCLTCLQSKANIGKSVDGILNMFSNIHSHIVFYNNISCVDVGPRNLTM